MTTAIVVDTVRVAKELNKILPDDHRAFAVFRGRTGWRCDRILVLATMAQDGFSEWFDTFTHCLKPGGAIIYD